MTTIVDTSFIAYWRLPRMKRLPLLVALVFITTLAGCVHKAQDPAVTLRLLQPPAYESNATVMALHRPHAAKHQSRSRHHR